MFEDIAGLADIGSAVVEVIDAAGGESNSVVAQVVAGQVVGDGGLCDLGLNARYACDENLLCQDLDLEDDEPASCQAIVYECPAGWAVNDLSAAVDWRVEGNLAEGELGAHGGGSCSGAETGQNDLYSFTAMAAGTYVFSTSGADGDTILWIREACGLEETEIDCNDDTDGLFSEVQAELNAGQTIYVFVDSFTENGRDAYVLQAQRAND